MTPDLACNCAGRLFSTASDIRKIHRPIDAGEWHFRHPVSSKKLRIRPSLEAAAWCCL